MIVEKIFARTFVGDGEKDFQRPRQQQDNNKTTRPFCFDFV